MRKRVGTKRGSFGKPTFGSRSKGRAGTIAKKRVRKVVSRRKKPGIKKVRKTRAGR